MNSIKFKIIIIRQFIIGLHSNHSWCIPKVLFWHIFIIRLFSLVSHCLWSDNPPDYCNNFDLDDTFQLLCGHSLFCEEYSIFFPISNKLHCYSIGTNHIDMFVRILIFRSIFQFFTSYLLVFRFYHPICLNSVFKP